MINIENNRFPHSAELFKFCKEVLNIRKNATEKITDQDVGALLGFDPADCTHWKYGRKNIKSIQNLNQLAKALDVDPRNLIDISLGKNVLLDALIEYQGYGDFSCAKEERDVLLAEANSIIERANVRALPIFVPEFSNVFPEIEIKSLENQKDFVQTKEENGKSIITWTKGEKMGTALRFYLAKELAQTLMQKEPLKSQLANTKNPNLANRLAIFLLMPTYLLQIAFSQCDPARDTVEQLMALFWMSRTLINIRLKDFLMYRN